MAAILGRIASGPSRGALRIVPSHIKAAGRSLLPVRCFNLSSTRLHISPSNTDNSAEAKGKSNTESIYTVNEDEIAKFAAMSDEWWAPQGPFKMLHLMNPPRIRYIRNRLIASGAIPNNISADISDQTTKDSRARFPLQGLRILDVGCGGGLLAEVMIFVEAPQKFINCVWCLTLIFRYRKALARLGATVTGLDASVENIQMARIHAKKDPLLNNGSPGSLEYRHLTAGRTPQHAGPFV